LNVLSIIDPAGDVLCRYAKLHPFSFAKESDHYDPGEGIFSCRIHGVTVTPFICYDLRFPEVFRIPARQTQVYLVPANWPATRTDHWDALLKARAIENQAFVVGVNRVGRAKSLEHTGHSAVYGPLGERLGFAGETAGLTTVRIDPAEVARVRAEFPVLPDMKKPGATPLLQHRFYRPVDQADAETDAT
ncbi:MAG: nitrilase-related carbon-nitrogen hydrolase, partial [Planctomycetota bacterium]